MPIIFDSLKAMLARRDIGVSRLKHSKIVGGKTYDVLVSAMDNPISQGVSIATIDALCKFLDCQPSDIMRYVPDDSQTDEDTQQA